MYVIDPDASPCCTGSMLRIVGIAVALVFHGLEIYTLSEDCFVIVKVPEWEKLSDADPQVA